MNSLESVALTLIALIVLFMVCRAIVLWYWKVNEQVALLKEIRDSLRTLTVARIEPPTSRVETEVDRVPEPASSRR